MYHFRSSYSTQQIFMRFLQYYILFFFAMISFQWFFFVRSFLLISLIIWPLNSCWSSWRARHTIFDYLCFIVVFTERLRKRWVKCKHGRLHCVYRNISFFYFSLNHLHQYSMLMPSGDGWYLILVLRCDYIKYT